MKRKTLLPLLLLLCSIITKAQSVYDLPLKSIDGDSLSLSSYAGKKVLFILLPLSSQDSVYQQVADFKARYADSVQVVGIMALENGYTPSQSASVKSLYGPLNIALTEGLFTRKAAGSNQAPLMQWLTDNKKNLHYNVDAQGTGSKFFVNEVGTLYAVLSPLTPLDAGIINRIMHTVPRPRPVQ